MNSRDGGVIVMTVVDARARSPSKELSIAGQRGFSPDAPRGASVTLCPSEIGPPIRTPGKRGNTNSRLHSPESSPQLSRSASVFAGGVDRISKLRLGSSVTVSAAGSSVSIPALETTHPSIKAPGSPRGMARQWRARCQSPGASQPVALSVQAHLHCPASSPMASDASSSAPLRVLSPRQRTRHTPPANAGMRSVQPPVNTTPRVTQRALNTGVKPAVNIKSQPVLSCSMVHPVSKQDLLSNIVLPGDVLAVQGAGNLMDIGAAGGYMGHVMLVVEPPSIICRGSEEATLLEGMFSFGMSELWRIRTLESTRREQGLHEADTMVFVEETTRRLMMVGELSDDLKLVICDQPVPFEIWQSPPELRNHLSRGLVKEVKLDMVQSGANWSTVSALRAVLRSSHVGHGEDMLDEVQECWDRAPICTTVVVAFWQRFLFKYADLPGSHSDPAKIILRWMPLKADRTLPNELLSTMKRTGWTRHLVLPYGELEQEPVFAMQPIPPLPPVPLGLQFRPARRLVPTVARGAHYRGH